MTTIELELDEPDSKSVFAGMSFGIGIAAVVELLQTVGMVSTSMPWWGYAGASVIWLAFAYLSYRDDRMEARQAA